MNNELAIKRGASLYSFQEEYFLHKMTLEDIIAACAKMDISGIEILGDQMIPSYPNVSDDFFKKWHGWMDKYGRTPLCLDMFLDWNKYKGRAMTEDEQIESVTKDIVNANKLGCTVIRVIHDVHPHILERLAPVAEKYNVILALEVHAPSDLDSPFEQELIQMFERVKSPFLGFTVDFGIYTRVLPRINSDRFRRAGMKEEIIQYLTDGYNNNTLPKVNELGKPNTALAEKILAMGGREEDIYWAMMGTHGIYADPKKMLQYMPYIKHVHAKFYEMLPEGREYSIPYEDIIPLLIQGGYKGYLSSEYEGNRWIHDAFVVDSVEQVGRHQKMLKRLLGEA